MFTKTYGLETVSLRYFNIFGPRQDPTSPYSGVLAKFITQMLRGERPTIFGDGTQSRDFTYVDNAVDAARGCSVVMVTLPIHPPARGSLLPGLRPPPWWRSHPGRESPGCSDRC